MVDKADLNRIALLDPGSHSEYRLSDPLEITAVLTGLVQQRTIMSAHPNGSPSFVLTTLLALDAVSGRLVFDLSNDNAGNQRMATASSMVFGALLDRIRIQFATGPLEEIRHIGYPAFASELPTEILRLQRREYYRLITPVRHSVTCNIPVPQEQGVKTFQARVLDISGGGVGVLVPPRGLALSTDMEFPECTLLLPEAGPIETVLRIRNIFRVTQRNGVVMTRAGCQFVDLPPRAENTIQRYILRIERERGTLARGR